MTVCIQEITLPPSAGKHEGLAADQASSPALLKFKKRDHTNHTGGTDTYYLVESESWYSLRRS